MDGSEGAVFCDNGIKRYLAKLKLRYKFQSSIQNSPLKGAYNLLILGILSCGATIAWATEQRFTYQYQPPRSDKKTYSNRPAAMEAAASLVNESSPLPAGENISPRCTALPHTLTKFIYLE